jgi:hypothetical protein
LDFIEHGTSYSGKTKCWMVRSKHGGEPIALVSWYGPWRKYVLYPQDATLYDASCLTDIAAFLTEQMEARRG